jgi:hypothetical protein
VLTVNTKGRVVKLVHKPSAGHTSLLSYKLLPPPGGMEQRAVTNAPNPNTLPVVHPTLKGSSNSASGMLAAAGTPL